MFWVMIFIFVSMWIIALDLITMFNKLLNSEQRKLDYMRFFEKKICEILDRMKDV